MINLDKYESIIFDFDGVILDSNNIKKNAIRESVTGVLSSDKVTDFVNYFISLNGIPRELKIAKFIPKEKYEYVLEKYENILSDALRDAKLIPGVKEYIFAISRLKKNKIVLSGGTQSEVLESLQNHSLDSFFDNILGGPKTKEENLQSLYLPGPVIYFGDSEVDYSISVKNNFDFVFVYGASSNSKLCDKFSKKQVQCIKDFC